MQCMTNAIPTGGSWTPDPVLENNSWDDIKKASDEGIASTLWAVGDTKSVSLNGKVGHINLNTTTRVFILGFDHNADLEGPGITFGCFIDINGKILALKDEENARPSSGSITFNINHFYDSYGAAVNIGGWKRCDLRYDILGSTDVPPLRYGNSPNLGEEGYDATENCAKNPVPNTLLASLPEDLRKVMKSMTVYTDNYGNGTNYPEGVTSSIDYLPLPSEYEISGKRSLANSYEQNYQAQYQFYKNGNSKIKYDFSESSSSVYYWVRSPCCMYGNDWSCCISNTGENDASESKLNQNISPMFRV